MLLTSFNSFSQTQEEIEAAEKEGEAIENRIDATNQYIATKWDQINRSVDMFFTNQNSKGQDNKSSILFYSSFYKKEGRSIENKYDFQVKFDLPNTTKKLKIVIEKQQDEISNAISDPSTTNNKRITNDGKAVDTDNSHYTAGASFLLKHTKSFASNFNFGIRLDMPLNPFAKIELQKKFKDKIVNTELSQKLIMYRQEGLQSVSQLIFNRNINKVLQANLINSLIWADETDEFVLRNNFVVIQKLGYEKTLTYSVGANAKLSPTYYYDNYDASISYRQLVYKDWLYATWTVGADFPKDNDFNDEKFVEFRIDIFFIEK